MAHVLVVRMSTLRLCSLLRHTTCVVMPGIVMHVMALSMTLVMVIVPIHNRVPVCYPVYPHGVSIRFYDTPVRKPFTHPGDVAARVPFKGE